MIWSRESVKFYENTLPYTLLLQAASAYNIVTCDRVFAYVNKDDIPLCWIMRPETCMYKETNSTLAFVEREREREREQDQSRAPSSTEMSRLMMFPAGQTGGSSAMDEDPWANYSGAGDVTGVSGTPRSPQTSFLKKAPAPKSSVAFGGSSSRNSHFNLSIGRSSTPQVFAPFGAASPGKMVCQVKSQAFTCFRS